MTRQVENLWPRNCEQHIAVQHRTHAACLFDSVPIFECVLIPTCCTDIAYPGPGPGCFPAHSTIEVLGLGAVRMDNLQYGDKVRISFPLFPNDGKDSFLANSSLGTSRASFGHYNTLITTWTTITHDNHAEFCSDVNAVLQCPRGRYNWQRAWVPHYKVIASSLQLCLLGFDFDPWLVFHSFIVSSMLQPTDKVYSRGV